MFGFQNDIMFSLLLLHYDSFVRLGRQTRLNALTANSRVMVKLKQNVMFSP